jgi:hypothetical protein
MHRRVGDDLPRRYRNAPIAEAVCELRLDPGLPWDSATPGCCGPLFVSATQSAPRTCSWRRAQTRMPAQ